MRAPALQTTAIALALITLPLAAACSKARQATPATLRTVTFEVGGMTCGGCVKALTKALKGLDGVLDAKVELQAKRATVRYRADKLDAAKMIETIKGLGYEAQLAPGNVAPASARQGP